jgi:hypothetical protein
VVNEPTSYDTATVLVDHSLISTKNLQDFRAYPLTQLNTHMENQKIRQLETQWLRQNGISAKHFANTDVLLLKAQRAAHCAVTHHAGMLTHEELAAMQRFLRAMQCARSRISMTTTKAYQVLNTTRKLNRQLYRQRRQF